MTRPDWGGVTPLNEQATYTPERLLQHVAGTNSDAKIMAVLYVNRDNRAYCSFSQMTYQDLCYLSMLFQSEVTRRIRGEA